MNPEEALALLKDHVRSDALIEHCVATGAVLRSVAPELNGDPGALGRRSVFCMILIFEEVDGGYGKNWHRWC